MITNEMRRETRVNTCHLCGKTFNSLEDEPMAYCLQCIKNEALATFELNLDEVFGRVEG